MINIDKSVLVKLFISNSKMTSFIVVKNREIIDFYIKNKNYKNYKFLDEVIEDIIRDFFIKGLVGKNIREIIINLKDDIFFKKIDNLICDFIDSYDDDLLKLHNNYFSNINIKDIILDDNLTFTLKSSQYCLYRGLLEDIKLDFIEYLKSIEE